MTKRNDNCLSSVPCHGMASVVVWGLGVLSLDVVMCVQCTPHQPSFFKDVMPVHLISFFCGDMCWVFVQLPHTSLLSLCLSTAQH